MKALVFDGKTALKELPKPKPAAGEALIKILIAGICNTDLEITHGYMGFKGILGHEFVGLVEQCSDPDLTGKRVVGEINVGCGQCEFCRQDLERHCLERTVLGILNRDGAMAEYLVLPESNLVVVPESVPDEKAVFTEPLAAAVEILEQVKIEPNHRVLIIGDGKLGLLIGAVIRLTGCGPILAGKHTEKMEFFSKLGGTALTLEELSATGESFDFVIEASGNPSGWDLAMERVKPRGTIVLKSTYHAALDFNPAALVIDEITVVGSRCGRFAPALRLMEQGLVDPTPFLSDVFPLEEAVAAFERAKESDSLKILLKP